MTGTTKSVNTVDTTRPKINAQASPEKMGSRVIGIAASTADQGVRFEPATEYRLHLATSLVALDGRVLEEAQLEAWEPVTFRTAEVEMDFMRFDRTRGRFRRSPTCSASSCAGPAVTTHKSRRRC